MQFFTYVTKTFYLFGKHFFGFYLNYARFLNVINKEELSHIQLMLILSGFPVTISMFLHTLKFKKYISPRLSIVLYVISYLSTLYTVAKMYTILDRTHELLILAAI